MRSLYELNRYRVTSRRIMQFYGSAGDDKAGVFSITVEDGKQLLVVASSGEGWDHLSVSREDRCPTWEEMEFIKRLFFKDDEVAMQLHVEVSEHISFHPNCLHLWAPHQPTKIPRPPAWMVGPATAKEKEHG